MNKLLLRKLWNDKKDMVFSCGLVLITMLMLSFIIKLNDSIGIFGIGQLMLIKTVTPLEKSLYLTELFYLIPFERKERRKAVRIQFLLSCLIEVTLPLLVGIVFLGVKNTVVYFFGAVTSVREGMPGSDWWKIGIFILSIVSIVHMLHYQGYLKKTKEGIPELLVIAAVAKWLLCIVTISVGKEINFTGVIFYLLFAIPLFSLDIYYPVKYFRKMVDFYADYEYSRGIKLFQT